MSAFPPQYQADMSRHIAALRVAGYTWEEVAKRTGLSVKTCRRLWYRASPEQVLRDRRGLAHQVSRLLYDGMSVGEVCDEMGLSRVSCLALAHYSDWKPPAWPKVTTLKHPDGSWEVVRT